MWEHIAECTWRYGLRIERFGFQLSLLVSVWKCWTTFSFYTDHGRYLVEQSYHFVICMLHG